MIVFKLGGSMLVSGSIRQWLKLISARFKGRAIIVPGGGLFADHVRCVQKRFSFGDDVGHDMALHSMSQMGILIRSFDQENLCLFKTMDELAMIKKTEKIAILENCDLIKKKFSPCNKNWDTTSDTIALMVANTLNAKALLLVKSCSSPFEIKNYRLSQNDIERLVFLKILDKNFSSEFREGQMEVLIFFRDQVPDKLDY